MPPWIAVVIIGREFLVSGLRSIAASEGFTIEASEIGKLKTVIQIVSVVAAILAHRWDYWLWFPTKQGGGFVIAVHMIALWAIYWMTIVSIISATDYFVGFWKKIDHASERARTRRSFVLSRRKKKAAAAEHPLAGLLARFHFSPARVSALYSGLARCAHGNSFCFGPFCADRLRLRRACHDPGIDLQSAESL